MSGEEMTINVLSLFDGISCGRLALDRAGIAVANYYSSEIDKHAITISQKNYPDNIALGDVRDIKGEDLPKIDLLIGGSPCQGFSKAGKQLNFDDPRSKLFFEFVRVLEETKPRYFLLENVKMKKEYQEIITKYLGVEPILINSNTVSAQNRSRLYWTNIPNVGQPEDKGIMLTDILEDSAPGFKVDESKLDSEFVEKYKDSTKLTFTERRTEEAKRLRREYRAKYGKDFSPRRAKEMVARTDNKSNCLTATYSTKEHLVIDSKGDFRKFTPIEWERLQTVPEGYTEGVSDSQRYKQLGNGWTVDVIAHIFKNLKEDA